MRLVAQVMSRVARTCTLSSAQVGIHQERPTDSAEGVEQPFQRSPVPARKLDVVWTEGFQLGAFDWKGSYNGGTFACASPDGELLTTAIVFKDDGTVKTLVARSS